MAVTSGTAWTAVLASASGLALSDVLRVLGGLLITSGAWLVIKHRQGQNLDGQGAEAVSDEGGKASSLLAVVGIAAFFGSVLLMLATASAASPSSTGPLGRYLASSSIGRIAALRVDMAVWLIGVSLFFTSPCNALVRMSLDSIGTPVVRAQQRLKGGRLIGPLERGLIFGLALAGAATAAALVVSAKGLLRFPELNGMNDQEDSRDGKRIDEVTEYLLVGSLVSWTLALLPLLLTPT